MGVPARREMLKGSTRKCTTVYRTVSVLFTVVHLGCQPRPGVAHSTSVPVLMECDHRSVQMKNRSRRASALVLMVLPFTFVAAARSGPVAPGRFVRTGEAGLTEPRPPSTRAAAAATVTNAAELTS